MMILLYFFIVIAIIGYGFYFFEMEKRRRKIKTQDRINIIRRLRTQNNSASTDEIRRRVDQWRTERNLNPFYPRWEDKVEALNKIYKTKLKKPKKIEFLSKEDMML